MTRFDRLLRKGSLFRWVTALLFAGALAQYAFFEPDDRFPSLFVVIMALTEARRSYVIWRRRTIQNENELLGTDPDR